MSHDSIKATSNRKAFTIVEFYFDRNDPALDATFALEANSCGTPRTTDNPLAYTGDDFFVYRYADTHVFGIDHFPNLMKVNTVPPKIDPGKSIGFRSTATVQIKDFISNDEFEIPSAYAGREVTGSHLTKLLSRVFYKNRRAVVIRGFDPDNYDETNVVKEHYLIDKFTQPDENGFCNISLVDELILIEKNKSSAPELNEGVLAANINNSVTTISITTTKTNEYGTTGATGYIRIDNEIMSYTVGTPTTNLTVVRGLFSTTAAAHDAGKVAQDCIYFNNANVISVIELMINDYTNIDGSQYIPTDWADLETGELSTYNYTNLLTRPTKVKDIFNQMIRLTGMSMYVDVVQQLIEIVPVPRFFNPVVSFTEREHFSRGTIKTSKAYKEQVTRQRIIWNKKDYASDSNNETDYENDYEYIDLIPESEADEWNTSEGKLLKTDWLDGSVDDTTLANNFALKEVDRFSSPPIEIMFEVDERWVGNIEGGGYMWLGSVFQVLTQKIADQFLTPIPTACQCTKISRASTDGQYRITGLSYNAETPPDEEFYLFDALDTSVNLRTLYDADPNLGPATATTKVSFIIDYSVVIGSNNTSTDAMDTGSWPAGAQVTLILNPNSVLCGAGGDGDGQVSGAATVGGPCLVLNHDLTLDNSGIIGSGGGGGGRGSINIPAGSGTATGGGGAGYITGQKGEFTFSSGDLSATVAEDGTTENGGAGGTVSLGATVFAQGGNGGDLGKAGADGIGAAGTTTTGAAAGLYAIDKNGYTLTETATGTIYGAVFANYPL